MRVAVFDLDGTLADTAADLLAAANVALERGGRDARLLASRDSATAFAGADTEVGSGTLDITVDGQTLSLSLSTGNNTLAAIRFFIDLAELTFEHDVDAANLLFFAKVNTVVGQTLSGFLSVLTRRI